MNKQNNPVTRLLEKMYELWNNNVDHTTQLVRWVLPREDKRMYEVFCRGESVHQWKLEHGVKPDQINFRGYGESKPIAKNNTDEGRQLNRRVEFLIL